MRRIGSRAEAPKARARAAELDGACASYGQAMRELWRWLWTAANGLLEEARRRRQGSREQRR